jgi:predicted outer membrane repeat protein
MNIKTGRHGLVLFFAIGFGFIHAKAIGDELHVPSQFQTIQSAIDAAADDDEIIVAGGHYAEAIDFQGKQIAVRSINGAGSVVLDASAMQAPAVTMIDVPSGAVLKGFTIRGGTGVPLKFNSIGGGAYVLNSSPLFEDCVFRDMKIVGAGAGAFIDGGSPQFFSCTFLENSATADGGGIYARATNINIAQCNFQRNHAEYGAAIRLLRSNATVSECLIVANGGGATGGGGGISATLSTYSVRNCIIADNGALSGRGLGGDSCTIDVQNTVIWGTQTGQVAHENSVVSIERSNIRACGG